MNEEYAVELNDEILCAYLDGELDPQTSRQVRDALETEPGARLRLERLRQADVALRDALPLPAADALLATLAGRASASAAPRRAAVIPWAMAASVVGLMAGFLVARSTLAPGFTALDGRLQQALQHSRADETSGGARVVLSFQAADGRYCRLFRADAAAGQGEGLACRDAQGWQLVAWDAVAEEAGEGFRAAGASALVDGAMSALGGQPALSADEERALIAREWRAP